MIEPPGGIRTLVDEHTGRTIWQLSEPPGRHIHAYFDLCPWNRACDHVVYFQHHAQAPTGQVIVHRLADGRKNSIGRTGAFTPHTGAMQQWHPDGRSVLYNDGTPQAPSFSHVDIQTGRRRTLPGRLRMIGPDGARVLFADRPEDDDAVLRKHEHGVVLQALDEPTSGRLIVSVAEALELHPRRSEIRNWHLYIKHTKWSPDGTRFFFVFTNEIYYEHKYNEQPRVKDLYVARADGTELRWLGPFGMHPSWHPDGRQVLFVEAIDGVERFVLMDVDTRERRQIGSAIGSGHPSFSPDGSRIVTDYPPRREGPLPVPPNHWALTLYDVRTDRQEVLTVFAANAEADWARNDAHPVWHPRGQAVLYNDYRSGQAQICIVPVV